MLPQRSTHNVGPATYSDLKRQINIGARVEIKPSPRILGMLGQIEFAEWQCLAELIDNSVDELMAWSRELEASGQAINPDDFCVEVLLPRSANDAAAAEVSVRDRGRGMTHERLQKAVRAGWSGNDLFDRLGLFGMGFNVATARLGQVTRVLTTRPGDGEWIGVEINLRTIDEDFEAPDITQDKDDFEDHGTIVTIGQLDAQRVSNLVRKRDSLRTKLGHVYSWILTNTPITIRVNGTLVRPKRLCAWDENRSVTYGRGANREIIPAVIRVDRTLPEAEACYDCGHWQEPGRGACVSCGSSNLQVRERRIHGWVGIQRFLDSQNFGIDFLRNGRKILTFDKGVFDWTDINDPLGEVHHEYPVDIPATKGRIIGEIHLDHVPVDYKKDHFDTSTREWKSAIEFLRGAGPLLPQTAQRLGINDPNNSPIARLHRGYRRNDPGLRSLTPGDGKRSTHDQALEWGQRFERGDADYQTDAKWWETVQYHERKSAEELEPITPPSDTPDVDAVTRALTGASPQPEGEAGATDQGTDQLTAAQPPSVHDRAKALVAAGTPIPSLSRDIRANSISQVLTVDAYEIANSPLTEGRSNKHAAVWLYKTEGNRANLFVDPRHELFTIHGCEVLDVALAEIAYFMLIRSQREDSVTIPQLMFEMRRDSFRDMSQDPVAIQATARDVVQHIRELVIEQAQADPTRAWGVLNEEEINDVERRYALAGRGRGELDSTNTDFITYTSARYLVRLFEAWPELFMDGSVFNANYSVLRDSGARRLSQARIAGLLVDVATLASDELVASSPDTLKRTRLSIDALRQLVDGG